ncbi:MAG: SLC13 family permease [Rhodospirillales bacterium]|jgi:di/tricarboxylate transporter|nr:SLC13 family permease [Rhodospirillales bacterium]MDP6773633.1 SLC13 family permease [Rhodospirillales bacterium]
MAPEQIFLLVLLLAVLVLFVWGRWRYDVVAVLALLAATMAGTVPFAEAFAGFGHPATVTVAAVLIISRGLQNSGAVDLMARHMLPPISSVPRHLGLLSGVAGALSAVMNNVGALALLMPAALRSAAEIKRPPALILMPLSFGSILGGLVTLIGTPPNIIVAAFRGDVTGTPFTMFDFSPVGGAVAIAGIAFIALFGWRLIPKPRRTKLSPRELFDIEGYVSEARVVRGTETVGRTLGEIDDEAGAHDAVIIGLLRRGRRLGPPARREKLRAGDVLVIEAGPEALGAVMAALHLKSTAARGKSKKGAFLAGEDISMAEAVVPPRSRIIGQARAGLRLRRRFAVNLLAVSRQGRPLRGRLGSLRFRAGDVLLLEGEAEGLPEAIAALGCLPLAERGLQRGVQRLAGLSILVFAAAVAAATAGLISLPVALVAAAAAMVVLGMVPAREIYDSVDWPVVVLLGAMIPVGQALDATGTTGLVAGSLVALAAAASPLVVLVIVMVVTMTLSDLMNNAATAVVMAPVAVQVAQQLGVSPDPFLMAVAVGASCAFLTPIGHQNNTLILGPGGYEFGDYWRMGLPLEVLIVIVAVPMVLWVWPL